MLHELDRAAAQPFINYPRSPWWYPLLLDSYFAAIVAALFLFESGKLSALIGAICLFGGALLSFTMYLGWYRSRWGTRPKMKEAPAEIRRAYRFYLVGVSVASVLTVMAGLLCPPVVTVAVTFVAATALIWSYERKIYPAACPEVHATLA